jgi:hypothetical protein
LGGGGWYYTQGKGPGDLTIHRTDSDCMPVAGFNGC